MRGRDRTNNVRPLPEAYLMLQGPEPSARLIERAGANRMAGVILSKAAHMVIPCERSASRNRLTPRSE